LYNNQENEEIYWQFVVTLKEMWNYLGGMDEHSRKHRISLAVWVNTSRICISLEVSYDP
jgi:hypothetical protein